MRMKKVAALGASAMLLMAIALPGCSSTSEEDVDAEDEVTIEETEVTNDDYIETWADGTYYSIAQGNEGEFTVAVTIEDGVMTAITVTGDSETEGATAIEELPDAMIEAQTSEVDGISGATVTSDALKAAVHECLKQAAEA